MKKTNKPSFATRAKQLQKKYSRAAFDPYEKAELEREMDALIQEQEAFKQTMGIDAMPQQQTELDANQAMMEGQMEEPMMFANGGKYRSGLARMLGIEAEEGYDPNIRSIGNWFMRNSGTPKQKENNVITTVPNNVPTIAPGTFPTLTIGSQQGYLSPDIGYANVAPPVTSKSPSATNKVQTSPVRNNFVGWNGGLDYSSFGRKPVDEVVPEVPVESPIKSSITSAIPTKVGSGSISKSVVAPSIYNLTPEEQLSVIREKSANIGINTPMEPIKAATLPSNLNIPKTLDVEQIKAGMRKPVEGVKGGSNTNQFLPSYIAAGTNILGNLGQMLMDRKPKNINFARYTPEEIDMTEQRLAAQREADLARSVGRTTARNLGMNAGQAMSNIISSESEVGRNLSNALLQSRLAEQTTNVGERNKAAQINAEIAMKEGLVNRGMQDEWRERQRGYLAGAVQTIPDAIKDINQIKYQYEYLKQMGVSEENALKWLNQKYPNYEAELKQMITKLKKE